MNSPEAEHSSEDRKDFSDQIPNRDTTNMTTETNPKEEEISQLEEEDSEPLRVNQDSTEVEVKTKEINQSKGEYHLWRLK